MNVARFDLNLLVVLDALLAERSVTNAARRVGITQPAMSNALARLRAALGDPLLVRSKSGMVPTPKAEEAGRAAAVALREVDRMIGARAAFDPTTSKRSFTIAASDYVSCVLFTPLLRKLGTAAPGVSIKVARLEPDLSLASLEAGHIDMTLGFFRHVPVSLRRAKLFADRLVGVVRRGHPILRTRCTARHIVAYDHLRIAPQDEARGLLDVALAKRGLERRVALTAPHFSMALAVAETDLVGSLPERLARMIAASGAVEIVPLGLPLPRITVDGYWHARVHDDPAHAWLRRQLVDAASARFQLLDETQPDGRGAGKPSSTDR